MEPDGRVSLRVGPRHTLDVNGKGGPDIKDEIGPIDYPDSYDSPARFITPEREFYRDPAAPADPAKLEWFCFHCSLRPVGRRGRRRLGGADVRREGQGAIGAGHAVGRPLGEHPRPRAGRLRIRPRRRHP